MPDLAYVPGEGHFVSDTEFSYGRGSGTTDLAFLILDGNRVRPEIITLGKTSSDRYTVSQSLRYGVVGGLDVGVSEACAVGGSEYDRSCGNPAFSALYRLLAQTGYAEFPINLDLAASYSPDVVSPGSNGLSFATGGNSGDISLTLSRAYDEVTLLARGGAVLNGRTKVGGPAEFQLVSKAYAQPYAEFQAQYKPGEGVFLTAGLRAYTPYDLEQHSASFGGSFVTDTRARVGASYQPEIGAAWLAVPDLLTVSLRYRHSFDGKRTSYDSSDGSLSSIYRDVSGDAVFLDIRVLWF